MKVHLRVEYLWGAGHAMDGVNCTTTMNYYPFHWGLPYLYCACCYICIVALRCSSAYFFGVWFGFWLWRRA